MSHMYSNISSQLQHNWNLSTYARQQKESRFEQTKLTEEQQKERLIQVYNNRPPVMETDDKPIGKQITATQQQSRTKCPLGVINPKPKYDDPRVKRNEKILKEQEWYASRAHSKPPQKPVDPLVEPQPDLTLQAAKIQLKPPPLLEKEKPLMQEHLVNPYIYITKIFKKNSEAAHIKHPDIWDKSTHQQSTRKNKQPQASRPATASEKKDKEERKQFYLKNLLMKEFLFKFFKQVNQLLKMRKFNKIIYKEDVENYDLKTLFQLWVEHKKLQFKRNPEQFLTKEQFSDFMLTLGLDPDRKGDAERFFEYCHEEVAKGLEAEPKKESQWMTMFKN